MSENSELKRFKKVINVPGKKKAGMERLLLYVGLVHTDLTER